jgi:hypothetical protein
VWRRLEKVVAVGDQGRIYAYDIGLATVAPIPATDEPLWAVWGSSLDGIWIIGGRELILQARCANASSCTTSSSSTRTPVARIQNPFAHRSLPAVETFLTS